MAEMRVALAAVAAIVGAGFASGREIATFFTNQGSACWAGAAACSALAGAATAMLVKLAARTRAKTLPQLYARVMDERCGETMQVVYSLLLLIVSAAMLSAAGELGALAISSRYARAAGCALAAAAALFAAKNPGSLSASGGAVAAVTLMYYIALRFAPIDAPETHIRGSIPASMALGALYAAVNIALAGGVICASSAEAKGKRAISPAKAGILTGIALFALLAAACGTLLRAGLTNSALPSVVLAAGFGSIGFAMSLIMLFAGVVTTLGATLYCLKEQTRAAGLPERACMPVCLGAALLLSVIGFQPIVDVGYPLLGFLCALLLPALAAFL